MKKAYVKPEAKKVSFQYDKVVVASGELCQEISTYYVTRYSDTGCSRCNTGWEHTF